MVLHLIVSSNLSIIISVIIGNIVGIYYLKKLNNDWEELFRNIEQKKKGDFTWSNLLLIKM